MEETKVLRPDRTDLTTGPVLKRMIVYSIPIILTSWLQLLFNAADLVVVGRFRGSIALAAVGATGAITNLIVNLFIGLSVGTGVSVAHAIGAKDDQTAHRTVHTALPTALISGIFLAVFGTMFAETVLTWMGTPEDVLPLSARYMRIYFCGMPFSMVYNFSASILRAAGETRKPLVFLTSAGVINVIFNVIFTAFLGMNVEGVALATVISQGVSAVLVVIELTGRRDMIRLEFRKLHVYAKPLGKIIRMGLPAGLNGSMFSISNVIIQSSVNSFGKAVMSGNAAGSNIDGFINACLAGFSTAALNFVGQAMGAKKIGRIRESMRAALLCCLAAGLLMGGTIRLFGRPLLGIYITDSPQSVEYGLLRLTMVSLPYFVCAFMDAFTATLRGMGRSFAPMLVSVIGICGFRMLWLFTVFRQPAFHSYEWILIGYPISWALTGLGQYILFRRAYRRLEEGMSAAGSGGQELSDV